MYISYFRTVLFWVCKLDATKNCFDYGIIIIFHIQLTVLMSLILIILGPQCLIQKRHFSINFFVPNAPLIQGWHSISVVDVFCYNSPHLPKIKKNFQTAGCYWWRGVRVGGWCCTNLIFLAKIFPDTTVDKSCICPKPFSTRALIYM